MKPIVVTNENAITYGVVNCEEGLRDRVQDMFADLPFWVVFTLPCGEERDTLNKAIREKIPLKVTIEESE